LPDDRRAIAQLTECVEHAREAGERPHAAVATLSGRTVARHDESRSSGDPTAHSIVLVLVDLARAVRSRRLDGATVYATHEPCVMCAGALVAARVTSLVFGEPMTEHGAAGSRYNVLADPRLGHEVLVRRKRSCRGDGTTDQEDH
jgi:tRNA(adenine34) deaminase